MSRRAPRRSLPIGLVVVALLGVFFFALPLFALVLKAPWSRLGEILRSPIVLDALWLSVVTSLAATALAAVVAIPLALLLARSEFPGRRFVRALVTLPLILPPVVAGAALLFAFGRRGVAGEALEAAGIVLPFSTWAVVLANAFVAMPFLVITVEAGLRAMDRRYEGAAASLGADRLTVLRRVTLPLVGPSLAAGLVLAWARAFGEFGATVTFAGSLQGRTQTLPLAVFVSLEGDRDVAVVISLLMVAVSLGVLLALRDRWWGGTR